MPGQTSKKLFLILLILIAAFILGKSLAFKLEPGSAEPAVKSNQLIINNYTFRIENADSDESRSKGLSGRDKIADDEGMLFTFPRTAFYHFWMYDMKFPLDIIWIKEDKIVDISENVPIPSTENLNELPTYSSKAAIDRVLEINAGMAKKINAAIGDKISYKSQ